MSISCGGNPSRKIHYLDLDSIASWSDVGIVASDGSTLMTNRLLLASLSDMFLDLVLTYFCMCYSWLK